MNPNRLNSGKLEGGQSDSKKTATDGEIRSTLSFISWWRARTAMMLIWRARISSEDSSLASDEVHDVETERDSSMSGTALGSLSTKLSLQFCLSLPSLTDWSSESNLLNKIAKTESENEEIKMQIQMRIEVRIGGMNFTAEKRSEREREVWLRGEAEPKLLWVRGEMETVPLPLREPSLSFCFSKVAGHS